MRTNLFAASFAVLLGGCFSWYSDGPEFSPPARQKEGGLVVVYRPQAHWGALYGLTVIQETRECELVAGSYCTLYFEPGRHTVLVTLRNAAGQITVPIPSPTLLDGATTRVPLEIERGDVLYVEAAFDEIGKPPSAKLVATPSGDVDDTHVAPGGRARAPVSGR